MIEARAGVDPYTKFVLILCDLKGLFQITAAALRGPLGTRRAGFMR